MNIGPAFWLIMTVGGAVLVGVALAYGLISTRNRRANTVAQSVMDATSHEEDAKRVQ